jgi:hypothetical protein|tara:strand:- start:146 stop:373 length:228 start_codon:yes stop_codon:yes gene_type:complete
MKRMSIFSAVKLHLNLPFFLQDKFSNIYVGFNEMIVLSYAMVAFLLVLILDCFLSLKQLSNEEIAIIENFTVNSK